MDAGNRLTLDMLVLRLSCNERDMKWYNGVTMWRYDLC